MTEKLFTPLTIGDLVLPNRVVMAPLTRNRARPDGDVPHALNAEYYAQRAAAGLIVTEATQISPEGKGYIQTPGIYSQEQVAGWRLVTDAVHAKGGRIFLPALACRAHLACLAAARRAAPRRAVGDTGQGADLHRLGHGRRFAAARARARRDPAPDRRLCEGCAQCAARPASMASSCMAPTAI